MKYDLSATSLPPITTRNIERRFFWHTYTSKISLALSSGTAFYLFGLMASNGINFLFTILLGRFLNFSDFGILTVINAISYIGGILLSALSSTVTHRVSYLLGKRKKEEAESFFSLIRTFAIDAGLTYMILWLLILIPLSHFFHITSYLPILCLLPVLPCGFINSTNRGYLTGNLFLKTVGFLTFFEAFIKLLTALVFVYGGFPSFAYLSLPISSFFVVLLSIIVTTKKIPVQRMQKKKIYFPKKFFIASLAVGASTTAFLAVDVLVVKHFMSPKLAGEYAFLAIMGKIIYFCGSLLTVLIVSFVSREEGKGGTEDSIFYKLFLLSLLLTSIPYIAIGWFGKWILPIIFGEKAYVVLPYVPLYALAIALLTVSLQIVCYYLAKKRYIFTTVTIFCYLLMILGITFFHTTIWNIVSVVFFISIFELLLILLLHFLQTRKNNL
ncbi:MAG TPA: hypothetical protein VLF89_09055 [Candidatus Saccharimonadales bacterium]|nr:hypothetical protein [Candidatus Saccharimonadales bacterium]